MKKKQKKHLSSGIYSLVLVFIMIPFFANAKEGILRDDLIKKSEELFLHEDKDWLYLLHYEGMESVVDKSSPFFLSSNGYKDVKAELKSTINAFFDTKNKNDNHAICKFPARFDFIIKKTGVSKSSFPKVNCEGYKEFKYRAPADNVYIVFASENNMVANSIMGHVFIKISGYSGEKLREHALSYFAVDFNDKSLKSYFDVVLSSVDGVYSLSPYVPKRNNYLFYEQRPVWELELNLSQEQKDYIHKHMWELKEKNVKYSFIFHNCGTASISLLKTVYGDLNLHKFFETPIDYIKKLEKDGNIRDIALIPSPEYKLKMVRGGYDIWDIYKVRSSSDNQTLKQKYLSNMLHNFKESDGLISNDVHKDVYGFKPNISERHILDAKPSSRLYVGYKNLHKDALEIEFMPLYQNIYDVSKAYYDDFETKILSINATYDDKFYINRIDLLTMSSLVDSSLYFNAYSRYVSFAMENRLGQESTNLRPVVELGGGYSYALWNYKIKPYILPKIGYRYDRVNNFYFVPEVGVIMTPIDDVKFVLSYSKYFDSKYNNRGFNEKLIANMSYQISAQTVLNLKYTKYSGAMENFKDEFSLGFGVSF